MNEALEFYKLKPNYTKDDLKGVRNKFIKETTPKFDSCIFKNCILSLN